MLLLLAIFSTIVVAATPARYTKRIHVDLAEIEVVGAPLEPSWRGLGNVEPPDMEDVDGIGIYEGAWRRIDAGAWLAGLRRLRELVHACDGGRIPASYRDALHAAALEDFVRVYGLASSPEDVVADVASVAGAQLDARLAELGREYVARDRHEAALVVFRELATRLGPAERPSVALDAFEALGGLGDYGGAVAQAAVVVEALLAARAAGVATTEVESRIEEAVRRAAMDHHKRGKRGHGDGRLRDLGWARALYESYLRLFPESVAGQEARYSLFLRFYYADALWKLEAFAPAAAEYERVSAFVPFGRKEEQIVEAAIEGAVYSIRELLVEAANPSDRVRERFLAAGERYLEVFGREGDTARTVRYQLGRVLLELGRSERARVVFEELVDESSGPLSTASDEVVGAWLGLGALAMSKRDWARAADLFETVLRSRHDDPAALDGLERAYRELGAGQSVQSFLRSIGVEPERSGGKRKPPVVITTTPTFTPVPSVTDLRAVISANLGQVRTCYERQLQRDRALAGRITVRWRVGENRVVQGTTIVETRVQDRALQSCVRQTAAGWRFLPPHGTVDITCPFVFLRPAEAPPVPD